MTLNGGLHDQKERWGGGGGGGLRFDSLLKSEEKEREKEKREKRAPALNMSFQHPVSQQDIWVTLDPATLI